MQTAEASGVETIKPNLFSRVDQADLALCLLINRVSRRLPVQRFFGYISRLGDGVFWYALLALLPVIYGAEAVWPIVHIGIVALAGIAVYKLLKSRLARERPFVVWPDILCGSPPLDRYSFPSGHTLHAVSFSILIMHFFPQLGWVVLTFALLVALSRVILGLHYPTDVLAGALIGAALSYASLLLA